MDLGNLALAGVVTVALLYITAMIVGMIAVWPYGLLGLIVMGFIGVLFFGVLRDRMNSEEDDYYEKNIKD